jgi:AcrR family transcriptional regulator
MSPAAPASSPSQQRVLDAAARLQARGEQPTMESLARTAGLSRATLYRHVGGRRALEALLQARGLAPAPRPPSTRERLLERAAGLVAAHGAHGFTLEALALEARVSPATVYREFGDRTGLLRAVAQRVSPPAELLALLEDGEAPVADVLTRLVGALAERMERQPLMLRLLLLGQPESVRELRRLRASQGRVSVAVQRYLEGQAARGRLTREASPALLATALLGQVACLVISSRVASEAEALPPREARAAALVSLFLRGAAAAPAAPAAPAPSPRRP